MAPTIIPRSPSGEHVRHLARALTSTIPKLSLRDAVSTSTPLASIFALVVSSRSSLSRRALTSIAELSQRDPYSSTTAISDPSLLSSSLYKRQQNDNSNYILVIPATYKNINSSPAPGAVAGIVLGSVFGFILCLYILLLSFQFWGGGGNTTIVKEEVIIDKRRSHSKKSRKSSHHTSVHEPSPPAPPRSRRETIVEIEEEIIRHPSHHSPPPPSHHSLDEVIVAEEESSVEHTVSDEMVVVVEEEEEQSSIVSAASPSPPPRKQSSSRRSGFRTVDPAEFGGGRASMNRLSRRTSARSPGS